MKVYYIANARMPNEKAHAIQIAKVCEAFIEAGVDLTLVVPNRPTMPGSLREYYSLRVEVPLVRLPILNLYYYFGRVGFMLASLSFIITSFLYLVWKKLQGEDFLIYTVDMDTFSFILLPFLGKTYVEVHSRKAASLVAKLFFRHAAGIIATNDGVRDALIEEIGVARQRVIVEPNGVDLELFGESIDKNIARKKLDLPSEEKIALYVGRFYDWKGLEILGEAFAYIPHITCLVVGGSREDFLKVTGAHTLPTNVRVMGGKDVTEIPVWLAAADTLLILGTRKNESARFIAPMKVFENMATYRPVIVGATEVHKSLIAPDEAYFYEPDDARSLATIVEKSLEDKDQEAMLCRAHKAAEAHSWQARTKRIMIFIQ